MSLMKSVRMLAMSAAIFLGSSCASPTPTASDETDMSRLMASHIETLLNESEAQAVTLAVSHKGTFFTAHGGEIDPGQDNLPNDRSLFEIASITKTFVGILTADAEQNGLLSLDDDIRLYLDGDYPNLEVEGQPIQVRHLLTHTSGLPSNTEGMQKALEGLPNGDASGELWRVIYGANEKETRESFLDYLTRIELSDEPGAVFNYSNYGTNLMTHILEQVTGQTFGDLLSETIFEEAGMTESYLRIPPESEAQRVLGYNAIGESIPRLPIADRIWGGDGGLRSTPVDMARYMGFVLDASPTVTQSTQRLHKLDEGYWMGYFWWIIDTETGARSYRHDGGGAGVRNVMIIYPENDLGIYIVTNKANPDLNGQLTATVRSLRQGILAEGQ